MKTNHVAASVVLMLLAACSAATPESDGTLGESSLTSAASPYPKSTVITSIRWDFANQKTFASGSDLWPTTWAADGNVYSGWGDGGGFGGGNAVNRASIGFAKITGEPPAISGTNLWGNATKSTTNTAPAQHQATFCGKPESMMSAGGVLYAWVGSSYNDSANDTPRCSPNPNPSQTRLAVSTDGGASWKEQSWAFTEGPGDFVFNNFIEFGKDNAGAPGGYVYLYGFHIGDVNSYLARVLPSHLTTLSDYELFTGLDAKGNATWSTHYDTSLAKPVTTKTNGGVGATFYHAQSGRFLTTNFITGVGSLVIYDSPTMWGPFTTVEEETNWGGFGNTGESLAMMFPIKWISADGTKLWGVTSWGNPTGDALHLLEATITFGKTAPPPAGGEIVSGVGGRCLDDASDGTANGNKIQIYTCNGSAAQKWTYTNGTLVGPGGKCLDIQHDDQVRGTVVQLYQCNGTEAQKWTIAGSQIKSTSGLCLDVRSSVNANGTQVQVYTCNGTAAQSWTLK